MNKKKKAELEKRIAEACANDKSHMKKLSEDLK